MEGNVKHGHFDPARRRVYAEFHFDINEELQNVAGEIFTALVNVA
jgi:hypothetical protein